MRASFSGAGFFSRSKHDVFLRTYKKLALKFDQNTVINGCEALNTLLMVLLNEEFFFAAFQLF